MANIIVGIHGLANKPEKKRLTDWWKTSIEEGLRENCKVSNPNYDYHMIYWADLLYKHRLHEDHDMDFDKLYNDQPYIKTKKGALREYKDTWLDDMRAGLLDVGGDLLDYLKKKHDMEGLAEWVLGKTLKDLDFYYDEEREIKDRKKQKRRTREVLKDELKDALLPLEGNNIMLIAHSMGSIIAYDVLREIGQATPNYKIAEFVTIGSPLGLPHVKINVDKLHNRPEEDTSVRTPTIVKRWKNYADRKDPVALDIYLHDDYGPNKDGVRVEDDLVLNDYADAGGKRNHHKSYGYLRTPELSKHIAEFLS